MRQLKRQSVRFTFKNPSDEEYTLIRSYGAIKPSATDAQLLAFGQALATLLPGDQLSNVQVTEASDVEAE